MVCVQEWGWAGLGMAGQEGMPYTDLLSSACQCSMPLPLLPSTMSHHRHLPACCSTSAARHLASSGVDVYTVVAGAVGALYGPLHGGANEAVLRMLQVGLKWGWLWVRCCWAVGLDCWRARLGC